MSKDNAFIKAIKSKMKGAGEAASNYNYVRKSDKKSRENLKKLAISRAKKRYKKKTGKEMTLSKLNDEALGGRPSQSTRGYRKNRDAVYKQLKKKYKL